MQHSDIQCNTASATSVSAEELEKQRRKEKRKEFLAGIRDSLGSVIHQLAFSPAEAGIVCGRSPTWAYRRIYAGKFRVTKEEDGSFSFNFRSLPRVSAGIELLHEFVFPEWRDTEKIRNFFIGPNVSYRRGNWFVTITALAQATDTQDEPDFQLRTIFGMGL